MRASEGKRIPRNEDGWAYEIAWDGARVLVYSEPGRLRLESSERGDVTAYFPETRRLNRELSSAAAIFDGVVVGFGRDGLPVAGAAADRLARNTPPRPRKSDTVSFSLQIFDFLHHDGTPLFDLAYEERRERLEALELSGDGWQTPSYHLGEGSALLERSAALGVGGIVAKRLESGYDPGVESKAWRRIERG